MTVRFYTATDPGAPQIVGATRGGLIPILDACLVNGYGSKPGAGWSKPFADADNVAVYKQGAGSNGMYLRFADTGSGTSKEVGMRGYEAMTGVSAGQGAFPLETQLVGDGLSMRASGSTSTSAPRLWAIVADERAFYFWWRGYVEEDNPSYNAMIFFGDLISYRPDDAFATALVGGQPTSLTGNAVDLIHPQLSLSDESSYAYLARAHTQGGGAVRFGKHSDSSKNFTGTGSMASTNVKFGSSGLGFPNGPDGGLYLARVWAHERTGARALRGHFPGLWNPCHSFPFQNTSLTTFQGSGDLAGRSFVGFGVADGQVAVETSDTWR